MTIAVDFSGCIFAAIHTDLSKGGEPTKEYIRHCVINIIRSYNKMHRDEYGELIIVLDSVSWRDDVFPLYKFERRKDREQDDNDWSKIFEYVYEVQDDMREFFPFQVLQAHGAEADDIIGYMAKNTTEPFLIISNDKDFGALTGNSLVDQYRPCTNKMFTVPDTKYYEFELIVTGDKADGIPSVLCNDDFYKNQWLHRQAGEKVVRARPVTAIKKKAWYEAFKQGEDALKAEMGDEVYNRYLRNHQLISLDVLPESVEYEIRRTLGNQNPAGVMKTLNYLTSNRMNRLAAEIADFNVNKKPRKVVSVFDL